MTLWSGLSIVLATLWSAVTAPFWAPWRLIRALRDGEARKGAALVFLAGAGVAMTAYAGYALWLVRNDPRSALYLGLSAHLLIGIVITGYAGLLVRRQVKVKGPLGMSIEANDEMQAAVAAGAVAGAAAVAQQAEESAP